MTTRIRSWNTSAASNNQTPPFGAPEGGTNVNQVSDIFRQVMAEVRAWYEAASWIDLGHTPTYSSATAFTVTGNQTSIYEIGRRVRAINATLTTIYGTITASAYTVTTLVTVAWDSGSLDNTVDEVAVGAATVTGPWITFRALAGSMLRNQMPAEAIFQTGMMQPFMGLVAPTGWILWWGSIGSTTSGATNRANADTEALYKQVWDSFADSEAAVAGGRGASATADYAANKPIALPDGRGRVVAVLDNLGGSPANCITSAISGLDGSKIGAKGGDQRMHQHNHTYTDNGHSHALHMGGSQGAAAAAGTAQADGGALPGRIDASTIGITINNAGAGASQNVQPTIMLPYIVKL